MTNYLKKAVLGIGWVFIFSMLAIILSYFFRLALARNLSADQFGLFYAVMAFTILLHVFHDPGLKSALIKFLPEFVVKNQPEKINKAIKLTLAVWMGLSAIFSIFTIIFASQLANYYFKDPNAATVLIFLAVAFLLQSIDYLTSYVFQGFQRMGLFAAVDFSRAAAILIITLAGFVMVKSPVVPAAAYVISSAALSIIFWPVLKRKVFPQLSYIKGWDNKFLKKMMWFGIPVTLSSFAYTFFQQISTLVLTYFRTLEEVGLFNAALPTAGLLISISSSITYVIFPLASELSTQGHFKHIQEGVQLIYKFVVLAFLPLSLGMFMFANLVMTLLFGENYAGAAPALMILAIGTLFWIIASINFNLLAGMNRSKEPMKIMVVITIASAVLNPLLIPFLGLAGAALAIAIGYLLAMVLSIVILRKHVEIKVPWLDWGKNCIAGLAFLGTIYGVKELLKFTNVFGKAVLILFIAGIIYLVAVLLLKIVTVKEIKQHVSHLRA